MYKILDITYINSLPLAKFNVYIKYKCTTLNSEILIN